MVKWYFELIYPTCCRTVNNTLRKYDYSAVGTHAPTAGAVLRGGAGYPQFLQPITDTGWGRLAQRFLYVLPRTRTRFEERGFFYSGQAAWNILPFDLHHITNTSTFRKRLKTVLFDRAYYTDYYWRSGHVYITAPHTNSLLIDWLTDWLIHTRKSLGPLRWPHRR